MTINERPIPEAAFLDKDSVEMLRVWIAGRKLHCSLKIGMYQESTSISEPIAWGTILADAARHIAHALETGYGLDPEDTIRKLRDSFLKEIEKPSSPAQGKFLEGGEKKRLS
jgi:hypothetical protein